MWLVMSMECVYLYCAFTILQYTLVRADWYFVVMTERSWFVVDRIWTHIEAFNSHKLRVCWLFLFIYSLLQCYIVYWEMNIMGRRCIWAYELQKESYNVLIEADNHISDSFTTCTYDARIEIDAYCSRTQNTIEMRIAFLLMSKLSLVLHGYTLYAQ